MAVYLREEAEGKVCFLQLSGKLVKEDYDKFVPEIERLIQQHREIRILCELKNFHGWGVGALWEDIKFDAKHWNDIERLAIVGETKWHELMSWFCKPFTTATVRYFDSDKLDEAYVWIQRGIPVGV